MIVAVDTGGTKTLVAVFDTEGKIVAKQKFPTPVDVTDYITELKATIDELIDMGSITRLSVALPGTIVDGHMVWAGNLGWHDTNMKALLADHYSCPIIVENDANLAGLAETKALSDTPRVSLYITVSTGIGTGVITDNKINPYFSTAEPGYMPIEHDGEFEYWEKFASGKAILSEYGKLASEIEDETTWRTISRNIAKGLMPLCAVACPDVVIVGGGVGTHFEKFAPHLRETMQQHLLPQHMPTIIQAAHPEEAVIYGCYYHAIDIATA